MPKYLTKQRKALLDYFETHTDEPVTAKSIADALECEGISISTVYRNLSKLEREGIITRSVSTENHEVCYKYSDAEECRGQLHLACKKCGKMLHMNKTDADALVKTVADDNEFTVDRADTVIYGICSDCKFKK